MKSYLTSLLFFLLMLSVSCQRQSQKQRPVPTVAVAPVEQRDVPIYIDTIGQAIPPVTVNIRPQAAGKLIGSNVQQGDIVTEGDVLYTIDASPYMAILDEAKAQLAHDEALLAYAEKTVERYKLIVEDDFISKLTYEQYESNAAAAKAQVELDNAAINAAQINVNYCKVVAPVSGKISYQNVDVGNIVSVDDPNAITVIRPFSPIDVSFSLPQQQFELVRREQGDAGKWHFVATLPENLKETFNGITYFLDNQVDQDTGTILLKGRLPNLKREFWPGEFIQIKVLHKMAPKALIVPPGAILIGRNGPYLYIVDKEHKVHAYNVTVLTRTEEYIAIRSDAIKAGDTVVTDGQINIAPGMTVKIISNEVYPRPEL